MYKCIIVLNFIMSSSLIQLMRHGNNFSLTLAGELSC